jgi:hypothetical protein
VDGKAQTDVVFRYFQRVLTPFSETWYAPIRLNANQKVRLDAAVWTFPWVHRVGTQIRGMAN